jgi:transposase
MARKRLTLKKIKEVIRLKYEAGLSNRAIASACRISNSTVGEYLKQAEAAGLSWPIAADVGEEELWFRLYPHRPMRIEPEPKYPMPDWEKVEKEKRKKGVTLQLLWQEYRKQYPGGYQYSQFCEHFQRWKKKKIDPSLRKDHKGGEEMEVDYAGLKILMTDPKTGEVVKVSVFVATLPASNYIYAEAQLGENQMNWNNGHVRAFEYFDGVVKIVIPDNLKTGVTRPNYYEPGVSLAYQELAEYYGVAVLPTRVRKPTDKGACENAVQNVERWIIAPLRNRQFFGLDEVQQAIREQLEILNNKVMEGVSRSRRQEFEEIDHPNLRPLPARRYEYAEWKTATVHIDYHVEFDDHLYSVPYPLIHQKVDIRATENIVEISHQGKIVAIHARNGQHGHYSTLREHMPANHQFMKDLNAERLVAWASDIGPQTRALIQAALRSRAYPEQAFRTCLGILRLARKYDRISLEAACQIAGEARDYSYKGVEQELVTLLAQAAAQPAGSAAETLPVHANIRGAEYYRERDHR